MSKHFSSAILVLLLAIAALLSFHVESGESLPAPQLEKRAPGSWEFVKCPGYPTELMLLGWQTSDKYEVARYKVYVNGRDTGKWQNCAGCDSWHKFYTVYGKPGYAYCSPQR